MKKRPPFYIIAGLLLLFAGTTGCSLSGINSSNGRTASKETLMIARHILAESLSSDQSGLILSLNDAFTTVSENGFITAPYKGDHSGRGNETNYEHAYRPKSGLHIVSFKRKVQDALFSKIVSVNLRYRYRSENGKTIKFPQQHAGQIASIYYESRREGKITTLHKESHFVRQDTFLITGLNTPTVSISGVHHGTGTIKITPANAPPFKRTYRLEINLLNIRASAAAFNNSRNFWKKVSGTVSWQLRIGRGADSKKMGGTIKLGGAGMALINYRGSGSYRINLNNGDLKERDEEFEGRIIKVNVAEKSITLYGGRTLYLTSHTEIDQEAYTSLQAVSNAMARGIKIWTEGKGDMQNSRFIVKEIEFEKEGSEPDDDAENRVEFDDIVSSVNIAAGTFTLFGKVTVAINKGTTISEDGDYTNLQEVADALESGLQVSAEGEAVTGSDAGQADIMAIEVEFEQVDQNNDEED